MYEHPGGGVIVHDKVVSLKVSQRLQYCSNNFFITRKLEAKIVWHTMVSVFLRKRHSCSTNMEKTFSVYNHPGLPYMLKGIAMEEAIITVLLRKIDLYTNIDKVETTHQTQAFTKRF